MELIIYAYHRHLSPTDALFYCPPYDRSPWTGPCKRTTPDLRVLLTAVFASLPPFVHVAFACILIAT